MTNTAINPNLDKIKKSYNKAKKEFYEIDAKYGDNPIQGTDIYRYNYLADKMRKLNNEHFFASGTCTWLSTKGSW